MGKFPTQELQASGMDTENSPGPGPFKMTKFAQFEFTLLCAGGPPSKRRNHFALLADFFCFFGPIVRVLLQVVFHSDEIELYPF